MIFIISLTYTQVGAFTAGEFPLLTHVLWKKGPDKGQAGFLPLTPSPMALPAEVSKIFAHASCHVIFSSQSCLTAEPVAQPSGSEVNHVACS